MLKRLLVPLDGSSLAEQAIGHAAAIARAAGAEVDLVRVHQPDAFDGYDDLASHGDVWNEGHRYLEGLASDLESGASIRVTHAMRVGPAAEMIRRRTKDTQADLIVMTSHGRTGLSRAWFGSVADDLVHHAEVPVLILRPTAGESRHGQPSRLFAHILVPLDGSPTADGVLPIVNALAQAPGVRITLLRVVQPMPVPMYNPAGLIPYSVLIQDDQAIDRLVGAAKKQLAAHVARLSAQSTAAIGAEVVVAGSVARAIVDFAQAHDVDLVAITTHGRGASRLLVGSVADKVLRACDLPVLLQRCAPPTDPAEQVPETARRPAVLSEAPA